VKARNRPPLLESRAMMRVPAAPPTPAELLVRAKVAGPTTTIGRTEQRHLVEHLGPSAPEAWDAMRTVYGTSPELPMINPEITLAATRIAAARIHAVAVAGGRISFATAAPASLLGVYGAIVRLARAAGAAVRDEQDRGPLRVDGRYPRWLRTIDGVEVVTDGSSLLATTGADAAREWIFLADRPALAVADGPFALAAYGEGIEVVAIAGLDRPALGLAAARAARCTLVPLHPARPPRAYDPFLAAFTEAFTSECATSGRAM
jgi:hypothetical protein